MTGWDSAQTRRRTRTRLEFLAMATRHASRTSGPRTLTLKEWSELPEEVSGEWVDGVLEEEEMPNVFHELAVMWLGARLLMALERRGGLVLGSDHKYAVGARRGRKPDLAVFLPGRPRPRGRDRLTSIAPDIAVEVITPTPRDARRDRLTKAREYARFGVRWYWLLDPAVRSFEIFERDAKGRYAQAAVASDGKLKVPGVRGLTLDLDALWRYLGSED